MEWGVDSENTAISSERTNCEKAVRKRKEILISASDRNRYAGVKENFHPDSIGNN